MYFLTNIDINHGYIFQVLLGFKPPDVAAADLHGTNLGMTRVYFFKIEEKSWAYSTAAFMQISYYTSKEVFLFEKKEKYQK